MFCNGLEYFKPVHSCMPSPLAPHPIRVQSCVCCLFWTNRNSMAGTSIFLSISLSNHSIGAISKCKYLLLLKHSVFIKYHRKNLIFCFNIQKRRNKKNGFESKGSSTIKQRLLKPICWDIFLCLKFIQIKQSWLNSSFIFISTSFYPCYPGFLVILKVNTAVLKFNF